ncbi:MAG: hypothetical protein WCH35_09230 [Comamonadaceae bacterium]
MTNGAMREGVITEVNTCREFVIPRLIEAGWSASSHAKAGLEHADPNDLIARMRGHEGEVMRLLGEMSPW